MNKHTRRSLRALGIFLAAAMIFCLAAVPAFADDPEAGIIPISDSPDSEPVSPNPPTNLYGEPYITGYTVTDAAGGEIQRVDAGQKCRIVIAVVDPRITSADQLTLTDGRALAANIKLTSTASFITPSLGDITTTTFTPAKVTSSGLSYAVIFNDITYAGGDNKVSFDLAYNDGFLPLKNLSQAVSQCRDKEQTPDGAKASALVITAASYGGGSIEAGSEFSLTVDVLASGGTVGAENVAVNLALPEQFTVASGSTNVFLGSMSPGASKQVTFQLTASAVANAGSYNISVNATGNTASDSAPLSAQMPVTVPVTQPERFEISRTNFPEYLSMGEEGYATVSLLNKGKGAIYNVSAELSGEGFTTTEGSQFIGNINPGTENSTEFTIQTTESGTLSGVLTVTYEDEKGTVKTLTKDFSMTVEGGMSFDDPGMMDPGMMDPGMMDPGVMPEENKGIPGWVWLVIAAAVVAAAIVLLVILKKRKKKRLTAKLMEDEDEDS